LIFIEFYNFLLFLIFLGSFGFSFGGGGWGPPTSCRVGDESFGHDSPPDLALQDNCMSSNR
jgi:hypothetical protein